MSKIKKLDELQKVKSNTPVERTEVEEMILLYLEEQE
jgi:hypothetical protein